MATDESNDDRTLSFVPLVSGLKLGRYEIISAIGTGGMGEVYLARDSKLDREVALKFLSSFLCRDEECRVRFKREAQAAARLNHPNIVTIFDVGEHNGRPLFSMEYVEGYSLRQLIKQGDAPLKEVIQIAVQVCRGLHAAHTRGIIHRDIKPANILIDADNRARIVDFGLASVSDAAQLTKPGSLAGTTSYISPEQVSGKKADHRSDLFSFGVVLYQMITSHSPFKKESTAATFNSILNDTPEPLARYRGDVPEKLQQAVQKLLSKDPTLRYQSAAELSDDLSRIIDDLPAEDSGTRPARSQAEPSIAVLPFTNLTGDKTQDYFCDGIAEEIINGLSHLRSLRVVARTSSFACRDRQEDVREIGRRLGVHTLLEGSVRRSGERLRVTAQLVNTADGYHVWSERFDRDKEDIFAIQDEISASVAERLKVDLLGKEGIMTADRHTENVEAYHLYLKGRHLWNKRTPDALKKSLEHFKQALAEDPQYALAYAGLADAYSVLYAFRALTHEEAHAPAREAAEKALQLNDSLAETHASMGHVVHAFQKDPQSAEKYYKKALSINPDYTAARHWYSIALDKIGRHDEALEEAEHALKIDPLSPFLLNSLAFLRRRNGNWDGAAEAFEQCLEVDPNNETTRVNYAIFLAQAGRAADGLSQIRSAMEIVPDSAWVNGVYGSLLYYAQKYDEAAGQMEKAAAMNPQTAMGHLLLGKIHLANGQYHKAHAEFSQAKELSSGPTGDWDAAWDLPSASEVLTAVASARMGQDDMARETLNSLSKQYGKTCQAAFWLGVLSFELGDTSGGFKWLDKALEKRDPWLYFAKVHPLLDKVRSSPKFTALLSRMGLE
jgi:serine/threonine protein kinase/tetratricopeptide (TPR) repeat protein